LAIIIVYAITGVYTPACLLAASISVEAVTPPLVGWPYSKSHFQTRWLVGESQLRWAVSYQPAAFKLSQGGPPRTFIRYPPTPLYHSVKISGIRGLRSFDMFWYGL